MRATRTVVIRNIFPGEYEVVSGGRVRPCHSRGELRQCLDVLLGEMPITEEQEDELREKWEKEAREPLSE